jgi:hypothetical protein
MPLDSMLVSAAVIAVFVVFLRPCSFGMIFKRGRRGSGSLCILKGAEALRPRPTLQVSR